MASNTRSSYSNHTQSVAYLIGETAAEKLIEEYGLDDETSGIKLS